MIYMQIFYFPVFLGKCCQSGRLLGKVCCALEMAFASLISLTRPKPTKNKHEICDLFWFCYVWLCSAAKREILFLCTCINTHLCSSAFSIYTFQSCHFEGVTNSALARMVDMSQVSIFLLTTRGLTRIST